MIKSVSVFLLIFFFTAGLASSSNAQTTIPEEVVSSIRARVENEMNVGIVIAVIDKNGPRFYSYGVKSKVSTEPVDENTVFEIGSVTKTFTALLFADMVKRGEVSMDDPLQKYLPSGITAPVINGASIKLVNLSNHTSALPRMPGNFNPANPLNPYADYTSKQMYDFLNELKLTRDIGSGYEYSNYGAGLLGEILATKRRLTYAAIMRNAIAKPLNMTSTSVVLTPVMKANLATGYNEGVEVENWDFGSLAGAGAVRSTAADLAKYIAANMGTEKTKLFPAMELTHQNSVPDGTVPMVGLGWHKVISNNKEIIWHNGGTGGYRAFVAFIKGGQRGVVVLSNSTAAVDDLGMHILNPESPLLPVKNAIGVVMRRVIDKDGIQEAVKVYHELKSNHAEEYDFSVSQLSRLGHEYLKCDDFEKAISVLRLNTGVYSQSSLVFFDLGQAFERRGEKGEAIASYRKSIELNPGNQRAADRLKALGAQPGELVSSMSVDIKTLESYVGQYQLAPGFVLTVNRSEDQLKVQATGQPEFPVFAKSENVFYYKVVEAQLTFNKDGSGQITSVTLHQAGREITGKKM